jgi:hypothetical protein
MPNENMTPPRFGQKKPKRLPDGTTLNPHRGDPDALFLGQPTAEQIERERLADQWDLDNPTAQ